jgi:hypothetical protein
MYRRDVPYCHRLDLEVPRPKMMDGPTLVYSPNPAEFKSVIQYYEREKKTQQAARRSYLIDMVAQDIKRLSHTKNNSKNKTTCIE